MEQTASEAYGFISYTPAYPGGLAVSNATGIMNEFPAEVAPKMGFGHTNPLFWLLIIVLILTGYISAGFSVGFKKLGSFSAKVG